MLTLLFPTLNEIWLKIIFYLCGIVISFFIGYSIYGSFTSTPRAKQSEILKGIKLPEVSGENQHGSAHFITSEKEIDSYYSHYILDSSNKLVKYLMDTGEEDNPDVEIDLSEKEQEEFSQLIQEPILKKGGIVVGKEMIGKNEKIRFIQEDEHTICLAGTGDGKTRRVVIPSLCTLGFAGESIIVSDPKGEIRDYTSNFFEKLGYHINVLDFKNPEKSMGYNPLQDIIAAVNEDDYDKAQEKTWDLVSIIVDKPGENTEKIWSNGEMAVIGACILSVVIEYRYRPNYQTLSNVYSFMANMSKPIQGIPPLKLYFKNLDANHPAKMILSISDIAPDKMQGSFFTSALVSLRLFTSKNIYSITRETNMNLSKLGEEKSVFYIILPDEKTVFYPVATMVVSQVYEKLVFQADQMGGRLKIRMNFILDEFGNFSTIPDMGAKITVSRSRGIRFMLVLQSFSQLEEKYGQHISKIIQGNCKNLIYMSGDDATREDLSKRLGTYTTISHSVNSSTKNLSEHSSGQSSSLMSRSLLTPDELGRIQSPDILTLIRSTPFVLNAEDLSKWHFNKMLGLGDKEHNARVRLRRFEQREITKEGEIKICVDEQLYENYEKFIKLMSRQMKQ